ncbi:hypothetical protein NUSPORA_02555 [Nucleospora cyclopteri]
MDYLKNIIYKTTDEKLLFAAFNKCEHNQQRMTYKISKINDCLDIISKTQIKHFNQAVFYAQIEIMLLSFFFNTIEIVIKLDKNENLIIKLYTLMITNIDEIFIKINNIKHNLIKSSHLKHINNDILKTLFQKIECILKYERDKIHSNLIMKNVFTNMFKQFISSYEIKVKSYEKNSKIDCQTTLVENKKIDHSHKKVLLKNILTSAFDLNTESFDKEIETKINQIYSCLNDIYVFNFNEIDIKYFVMIILYYDYLIRKIYLEMNIIHNTLLHSSKVYTHSKFQKYTNIMSILRIEKKIVLKFIKNVKSEYYKSINYNKRYADFQLKYKKIFILNKLSLLYDDFIDIIFFKISKKKQYFQDISELLYLTKQLKNFYPLSDLPYIDYDYQLSYSIFILRLYIKYSFLESNNRKMLKNIVINLINIHITHLTIILNSLEKTPQNINKIQLLKEIIEKNTKNSTLIYNNQFLNPKNANINDMKNFFYQEWAFEIKLFEEMHKIFENSTSLTKPNLLHNKISMGQIKTPQNVANKPRIFNSIQSDQNNLQFLESECLETLNHFSTETHTIDNHLLAQYNFNLPFSEPYNNNLVELEGNSSKNLLYLEKYNFTNYNDNFQINNTFNYNSVANPNYYASKFQYSDDKNNNYNYQNSLTLTTNFENRKTNFLPISSDSTYNFEDQLNEFDVFYSRYCTAKKRKLD